MDEDKMEKSDILSFDTIEKNISRQNFHLSFFKKWKKL